MRFHLKFLFSALMLCFALCSSFVNADVAGVCCYNPASSDITPGFGSCGENEVAVGDFSTNPLCDYQDMRRGCQYNGVCYATVFGKSIYDFGEIMTYFKEKVLVDVNKHCSLVAFSESCASDLNNNDLREPSGNNTPGDDDNLTDPDDLYNETETGDISEEIKFCSQVGDPYGFFFSESACNDLVGSAGNKPCIYNPYLSGNMLVTSPLNFDFLNEFEGGCMPKALVKDCFDYKTKELCSANPLKKEPLYANSNLDQCKWIESSEYFNGFDIDGGFCISEAVEKKKNFRISKYSDRLNMLDNPSFEDGLNNWTGNGVVIADSNAVHGENVLNINAGSVEQTIKFLDSATSYLPLLYIKEGEFSPTSVLKVLITETDRDGGSSNSEYFINLIQFNGSAEIYHKVQFNQHLTGENVSELVLSIFTEDNVFIDAVNFERVSDNSENVDYEFFKPLQIINHGASFCEFCYDGENLNFCNNEKSDILGDCSFMVEDSNTLYTSNLSDKSKYLGSAENKYIDNWSSMSIANARLFCEMYVDQNTCTDPENYVNSHYGHMHALVSAKGETLCQWDQTHGCFKDSDLSLGPDTTTISGVSGFVYRHVLNPERSNLYGHPYQYFADYTYNSSETDFSDFAYACDVVPPVAYMYFSGYDVDGKRSSVAPSSADIKTIGKVEFNLEVNDILGFACENFSLPRSLYVDYYVNDKTNFKKIDNSYYTGSIPAKSFFVDENNETILNDGANAISIEIKDQSGNIGYFKEFVIDVDINPPQIILNTDIKSVLGKGTILDFSIVDKSKISSCNFTLTPMNIDANKGIKSSFYIASGKLEDYSSVMGSNYKFNLPINETTSNFNVYALNVTCADVFDQVNSSVFPLYVDYNTDFVLLNPLPFISYEYDTGFLNKQVSVLGASVDKKLKTCEFDFMGTDGVGLLSVDIINDGFNVAKYSKSVLFYANITGTLDFKTPGIKNISIVCNDDVGNQIAKNYTFVYDDIKPETLNYSIISASASTKTAIKVDDAFYTRKASVTDTKLNVKINIKTDGTESWMSSENITLSYFNGSDFSSQVTNLKVEGPSISEEYYVAELNISSFNDLSVYKGLLTDSSGSGQIGLINNDEYVESFDDLESEAGLYNQTYKMSFMDKAGNLETSDVSFFYDDSIPAINFEGDVLKYNGMLFTRVLEPKFNVTFNTPLYRKFKCDVTIPYMNGNYKKSFDYTNNLVFSLSDILESNQIFKDGIYLKMNMVCKDEFDYQLSANYELYYDNVSPLFHDLYFAGHNEVYLPNIGSNFNYQNLEDYLVFSMKDTGEVGYDCKYKFTSTDYYCNDDTYNISFNANGNLDFSTGLLSLLSDDLGSGICYRNRIVFNNKLMKAREDNQILNTSIKVTASCFDKAGLSTGNRILDYTVKYVSGGKIVDFKVGYQESDINFEVTTMEKFDEIIIALDEDGETQITKLVITKELGNGVYVYSGQKSKTYFKGYEGNIGIWAIGKWVDKSLEDKKQAVISIDNKAPKVMLNIPDKDADNNIFTDSFEILLLADEVGNSGLKLVNLYVNGNKMYSSDNINSYDTENVKIIDGENGFDFNNMSYNGRLIYSGVVNGQSYVIKLEAFDNYGNKNETSVTVNVKDGIGIVIVDSDNAVVDYSGFKWLTKNSAPVLAFKTKKESLQCSVYPFNDEDKWSGLVSDSSFLDFSSLDYSSTQDGVYRFDMSSFAGFDITKVDREDRSVEILISCVSNLGKTYMAKRTLEYMNVLPDYVLESSKGFVFNGNDLTTSISVKSVGYNRYVFCDYSIDGANTKSMGNLKLASSFYENLDLSYLTDGEHVMNLECYDKLGTRGPLKQYYFNINRNAEISITDLSLVKNNKSYLLDSLDNVFYIDQNKGFQLNFKANRDDINCSYRITRGSEDVVESIINVFYNLFSKSYEIYTNNNPYYYRVEGIDFADSKMSLLEISCKGANNLDYVQSFRVFYRPELDMNFSMKIK